MKLDIRDLFDDFTEESIELKPGGDFSAERVLEKTMKKVKEEPMNRKAKNAARVSLLAAALAVILSVTAFAAYRLLSPNDIAGRLEDERLARAFRSEGTEFDFAPQVSGDYTFSLLGTVSGRGLSEFADVEENKTYVVGAVSRTDGEKIPESAEFMITPFISGYEPWRVNAFTIGGGRSSFVSEDGTVCYFIFDCTNIEIFADHTIYIAMYEITPDSGMVPSAQVFAMAADGSITFADSFQGARALFTLPVDRSKADPAAADALLGSREITGGSGGAEEGETLPDHGQEDGIEYEITSEHSDGVESYIIREVSPSED